MANNIKKINEKSVDSFVDFSGPIKHAARYHLWLPEAIALKADRNRYLRYFTLPGRWAWDIFFFEKNGILEKKERGFPNVRFCDNHSKYYTDAKKLLGNTIGKKENFEKLVLDNHPEFWDGFPYDLYNLDFCGTCFPDDQPPFSSTFEAIAKIIERHVNRNDFPFVIFLTMKALDSQTNPQAKSELVDNIEANRGNSDFTQTINHLIPDTNNFIRTNFADFIIVSIPKIICHLAQPNCNIEVKTRARYQRRNPRDGIFFITKFVFKFSRRRRRTLYIRNDNYISNVLNIMNLNSIISIDSSYVNQGVRDSLQQLKAIVGYHDESGG